jgi:hypothetical protein
VPFFLVHLRLLVWYMIYYRNAVFYAAVIPHFSSVLKHLVFEKLQCTTLFEQRAQGDFVMQTTLSCVEYDI